MKVWSDSLDIRIGMVDGETDLRFRASRARESPLQLRLECRLASMPDASAPVLDALAPVMAKTCRVRANRLVFLPSGRRLRSLQMLVWVVS